jgi:hypothetical protein
MPMSMMRQEYASSWIRNLLKIFHVPYFSELSPCIFWLFPKLKNALKGQRFADIPDIHRNMMVLQSIAKQFSGLFPAVAPASQEVHSFTRKMTAAANA